MADVISNLVFKRDGTLENPAQLDGLPDEVRARVTSPEFIAHAKAEIRQQRGVVKTGRRETRLQCRFTPNSPDGGLNRHERRKLLKVGHD